MVEKIIKLGADVNLRINGGVRCPIHQAVDKNNKKIIKVLLDSGASLKTLDKDGHDALTLSIIHGKLESFKAITDHTGIDLKWLKRGSNALELAVYSGQVEMAKHLICQGFIIRHDQKLLAKLVKYEKSSIIEFLVQNNLMDVYEENSSDGEEPIIIAIANDQIKNVEVLLKHGYSPNKRINLESSTLLHHTIKSGKFDMAKILIKYGADTNALDKFDRTAFSYIQDQDTIERLLNMDEFI